MRFRESFRHTTGTLRGPIGNSTEGSRGAVRMRPRHSFRRTPHELRGPIGAPPKVPVAQSACVSAVHFGPPLTRFVAPQELCRRSQWHSPQAP
eukprot:2370204-Pyramimonas_sp.AAC.1